MSRPVAAIASAVFAVTVFGVSSSGASYPRHTPRAVIAAALQSPTLKGAAAYFRRTPGPQRCVMHGGGPPPGSVAVETCWTDVRFHGDGSATVRLMISPPYTKTNVGQTWVFRVSRSLHARLVKPPTNYGIGAEA